MVVEHVTDERRHERYDYRTTTYARVPKGSNEHMIARNVRSANTSRAKAEGFYVPKKSRAPSQIEKLRKKDWQNERVQAKVKVNINETEHYNHEIWDSDKHKWVRTD